MSHWGSTPYGLSLIKINLSFRILKYIYNMNTLYKAIQAGLITSVSINKRGVVIYSPKKPHGVMYSWEKYNILIPTLKSKLQQLEEANAGTLEPQA